MMRNVALGAVIGFGLVVLVLSITGREAPPIAPQAPAAPAAASATVPDAGTVATRLAPEGLHALARPVSPLLRTVTPPGRIPVLERPLPVADGGPENLGR